MDKYTPLRLTVGFLVVCSFAMVASAQEQIRPTFSTETGSVLGQAQNQQRNQPRKSSQRPSLMERTKNLFGFSGDSDNERPRNTANSQQNTPQNSPQYSQQQPHVHHNGAVQGTGNAQQQGLNSQPRTSANVPLYGNPQQNYQQPYQTQSQQNTYGALPSNQSVPQHPTVRSSAIQRTNSGVDSTTSSATASTTGSNSRSVATGSSRSESATLDRLNRLRGTIFEETASDRERMIQRKTEFSSMREEINEIAESSVRTEEKTGSSPIGISSSGLKTRRIAESSPTERNENAAPLITSVQPKETVRPALPQAAGQSSDDSLRISRRTDSGNETSVERTPIRIGLVPNDTHPARTVGTPSVESPGEEKEESLVVSRPLPPRSRTAAEEETQPGVARSRGSSQSEIVSEEEMSPDSKEAEERVVVSSEAGRNTEKTESVESNDVAEKEENTESEPVPAKEEAEESSEMNSEAASNSNTGPIEAERLPVKRTPKPVAQSVPTSVLPKTAILNIEMNGPKKRILGQESLYLFKVKNIGDAVAEQVVLSVEMPIWAEIQSFDINVGATNLVEQKNETHVLNWTIDRLAPGEEQPLGIHLIPRERKTLNISWDYRFKQPISRASVEVQEPIIEMGLEGPSEMLYGSVEEFRLRIRNSGNGDAEDLQLTLLPTGTDPSEAESRPMGTLKAGEEKIIRVKAWAKQQDVLDIAVNASGPYGLQAETTHRVKVLRPNLTASVEGAEMQFVGNQTEYKIVVRNLGTSAAQNVEIKALIPVNAKYVSNQGGGRILPAKPNQVYWVVDSIPVGEEFLCSFRCEMRRDGICKIDVSAEEKPNNEKSGISATASASTRVESIADLAMKIENPQGPTEIGRVSEHKITITNRGSKSAENVEIIAAFAKGVVPTGVEGGQATINDSSDERGGQVFFEKIPMIGPRQTLVLTIKAKGLTPGNHKIRVEMFCDATDTHLVHEESSYFYSKQGGEFLTEKKEKPVESGLRKAQTEEPKTESEDTESNTDAPLPLIDPFAL